MFIQEDIYCDNCEVPILAQTQIQAPALDDRGIIPYMINMNRPKPGKYAVHTIMSVGWCAAVEDGPRSGDFVNTKHYVFEVKLGDQEADMDIKLEKYISPGDKDFPKDSK